MNSNDFINIVGEYLEQLLERIESHYWEVADCELTSEVLHINTEHNGVFIINRNVPKQELWLSSPISGGAHFAYLNGDWINTRTKEQFETLLFKELDQIKS